jgi:hypothetical protein
LFACDGKRGNRSRLKGSLRVDAERKKIHNFNNLLREFAMALEVQDVALSEFFAGELTKKYLEAVKKT